MNNLRFIIRIMLVALMLSPIIVTGRENGYLITADSIKIYYQTFGTGKPLLIINGGPGMSSEGFVPLAKALSKNRLVIIYDQRGTGKSKMANLNSQTITMKLMANDIESLRKFFKFDKWSVLGHSFGGVMAAYYVSNFSNHVDKLIFSSSGGIDLDILQYMPSRLKSKIGADKIRIVNELSEKITKGDPKKVLIRQRARLLAPAYVFHQRFAPQIADRLVQMQPLVNELIWQDLIKMKYDCSNEIKKFQRPVLIIQGREDIILPRTAQKAAKLMPQAKVILMKHCGHYGWLDNPLVYYKEIKKFLSEKV